MTTWRVIAQRSLQLVLMIKAKGEKRDSGKETRGTIKATAMTRDTLTEASESGGRRAGEAAWEIAAPDASEGASKAAARNPTR